MSRVEPARSPATATPWPDRLPGPPARRAAADPAARPVAIERTAVGLWRGDLYGALILLMLTGIVALDGIQQQRLLFRTDIITAYLPWYSHLGERLRDLDIPGWLPYSFSGAPFAGDPESGWMYLPAMVIFAVAPGVAGFNAFILFHLIVAGLATYALARLLGMSVLGAVVAGAAYEFGGFLERNRCCTLQAQVGAWLPVAFVAIEMAVRARTWLSRLGWWSLAGLAASQMLTGALGQFAYYGLLAIGAYTVYRTLIAPPEGRGSARSRLVNAAAHGGAILVIGLGLAAGGIWPRVEVVGRSLLSDGNYENVSSPESGWSLLVLVDRLVTLDNRGARWYAGGGVLALALLAPFLAGRRFSTAFWSVYTLLVLGLASREFWLHDLLYLLPQFADLHTHAPERALTIFYIGPALLAGAAVTALGKPTMGRVRLALLGLLPIASSLAVWDMLNDPAQGRHGPISITIGAVIAVCALVVVAAVWRRPLVLRLVTLGMLIVVFADPTGRLVTFRLESPRSASFIGSFHGPSDFVVDGYTGVTPAARELQRLSDEADQPVRYFGYDPAMLYFNGQQRTYVVQYWERQTHVLLVNNRSVMLELEDLQGYNPVQSARYVELMDGINGVEQSYHQANILYRGVTSPTLALLNARYIVLPATVPAGRPDLLHLSQRYPTVHADAEVRIVENLDALPRAWIVHEAQRVSPDRVFKLLDSGAVDPSAEVLLDKDVGRPAVEPAADPAAEQVRVTDHQPDEMSLDVTMTAPGLVVLSETYDPGWHAYLDGERVPVLAAFRALRAVPVPAGEHTLELRYEPPSLMRSLAISTGTAALLAVAAAVLLWRRSIGRPLLVGHRVEGWMATRARRGVPDRGIGERLGDAAARVAALPVAVTLGGLTLAGLVARLVGIGGVAPGLTERLTTSAGERPWSAAIGLDGLRAATPPLFVAAAKFLDLIGFQGLAEPLLAAVAGALTIPVVYLLATRLLGHRVGLAAAALLAVSPVHLALSRSGEQAAVGLLLVAFSYLALVGLAQTGERTWLGLYAGSLVVALYADPQSAYALAPQLLVGLALLRREDRRAGRGVLAAAGVALVAGIPWLVHLRDAATWPDVDLGRDDQLNLLWARLVDALPIAVGLDGLGSWLRYDRPSWVAASAVVLLVGVVPAGLAGLSAVRGRPAAHVCMATILGASAVAVLASLLADGLAVVTLAPALIGWSILASGWLARGVVGADVRRWGAVGWTVLMLTSILAIPAAYDRQRGEPWRDATPILTSQARLGLPIFVESGDAFADRTTLSHVVADADAADGTGAWLDDPAYEQIDATELRGALASADRPLQAFWLIPRGRLHLLDGPMGDLGFSPVLDIDLETYGRDREGRLQLWARPDAAVGEPVPIDSGFREAIDQDDTWRLSGATAIEETPSGESTLTITGPSSRATYRLPGGPGLYLVGTDVWTAGPTVGRATVKCADADEVDLVKQTTSSAEGTPAGGWQPVGAAILCPAGTESLAIVLDRRGNDPVAFRDVTLRGSPTDFPTAPPVSEEQLEAEEVEQLTDEELTDEELSE